MVDTVGGDPEDRSALKSKCAAGRHKVFDPLGSAEAAMRQQAVIGHADAKIYRKEIHEKEHAQILPGEEEKRGNRANVKEAHDDRRNPIDASLLMLAAHTKV